MGLGSRIRKKLYSGSRIQGVKKAPNQHKVWDWEMPTCSSLEFGCDQTTGGSSRKRLRLLLGTEHFGTVAPL
jgi:hypothetical protein